MVLEFSFIINICDSKHDHNCSRPDFSSWCYCFHYWTSLWYNFIIIKLKLYVIQRYYNFPLKNYSKYAVKKVYCLYLFNICLFQWIVEHLTCYVRAIVILISIDGHANGFNVFLLQLQLFSLSSVCGITNG